MKNLLDFKRNKQSFEDKYPIKRRNYGNSTAFEIWQENGPNYAIEIFDEIQYTPHPDKLGKTAE